MNRIVLAIALTICSSISQANAQLTIIPTFDSTITVLPNAATIEATINQAIAEYAQHYSDNITVRITFQNMTTGLGQSNTNTVTVSYPDFRTALLAHANTAEDASMLAFLPNQANSPVNNSPNVDLATANARALGLIGSSSDTDSVIGLKTSIMNLTRPPSNPNFYDLKAVAQHEMDEALGTFSGIGFGNPTPGDHARFSAPGVFGFSTSTSATAYFSVDGGVTNLVSYNQNGVGDYGDWLKTGPAKVQDWQGTPGSAPDLGVELRLLDVMGYTLVAVPEPTTVAFIGLIVVGTVGTLWRRRNRLLSLKEQIIEYDLPTSE